MTNFIETVLRYPNYCRQLTCGQDLITVFNCPIEARLMKERFSDLWSHNNYIFYVVDGRKFWHTAHNTYDLQKGSCVFVQKGASIVEQFLDTGFCVIMFFIPDSFIYDTLKGKGVKLSKQEEYDSIIHLDANETLASFFISMSSYFAKTKDPDPQLLELKFRELILTIADEPKNSQLNGYFYSLLNDPQIAKLKRIMNDNYSFNLSLEQYATLCDRSLSAFKRDFTKAMHVSPGKWLMTKRLEHAKNLITNTGKSISEIAFESGFSNPSHFSKAFKERYGALPTSLRKEALT